ncbi:unnamed protein product [Gadus morhua 'NCC']
MKALTGLLLLVFGHGVSSVLHSLQYFYTGSSGLTAFPEFVAVGMVDGVQIGYYDSNIQGIVLKQDWMERYARDDPDYLERLTGIAKGDQQWFKVNIGILKKIFYQIGGIHIYQKMYGCEWDDDDDSTDGYEQYGYDGEDFISLDLKTLTWVAAVPQAVPTTQSLNQDKAGLQYQKYYYTKECVGVLKTALSYGESTLQRTEIDSLAKTNEEPWSTTDDECRMCLFESSGFDDGVHAQVNDEHVQGGGVAMETADLKAVQPGPHWLQEYAVYLTGLNLTFLHIGEDSELEVDTAVRDDGWPVSIQIRLNPASLAVLRFTTGVCVVAIINHQKQADCWGCQCDCPSQRRHSCLQGATHHHYESHYHDICVILDRHPFLLLLETVLKKTTGLTVSPGKIYGVVESYLCDLICNTYNTEKLDSLTTEGVSDEHLLLIHEAIQMWRPTLSFCKPKPGGGGGWRL